MAEDGGYGDDGATAFGKHVREEHAECCKVGNCVHAEGLFDFGGSGGED